MLRMSAGGCVCVYVCKCVCMCVCMYVCVCIYICTYTYAYMTHTYPCVYSSIHVRIYSRMYWVQSIVHLYAFLHINIHQNPELFFHRQMSWDCARQRNSAQASFMATRMRQYRWKLRLLGPFQVLGFTLSASEVYAQVCLCLSQHASIVSFRPVLACICQLNDSPACIWNRYRLHHGVSL